MYSCIILEHLCMMSDVGGPDGVAGAGWGGASNPWEVSSMQVEHACLVVRGDRQWVVDEHRSVPGVSDGVTASARPHGGPG